MRRLLAGACSLAQQWNGVKRSVEEVPGLQDFVSAFMNRE